MPDLAEQLRLAERHQRAGRLREATDLLESVLRKDPQQAAALQLLALVAHQAGRLKDAHDLIQHAIAIKPDCAAYFRTLGVILRSQGKWREAIDTYRRAIHLEPEDATSYFNVGNVLLDNGQFAEAVVAYKMALKFDPRSPAACHNLGQSLERLGQAELAVDWYRQAIKLKPDLVEARVDLGSALAAQGKLDTASAVYVQALRYDPQCLRAHNNLGSLFRRQGKYRASVTSYQEALRIDPENAQIWNNLGKSLADGGQFQQAQQCFAKALSLDSEYAAAYCARGNLRLRLRQLEDALHDYQQALDIDSANTTAHLGRAQIWLLTGDFQRGWAEYEWRWAAQKSASAPPQLSQPAWEGEDLDGKTILLYPERHIGDTLHLVRYATLLKERGATVVLACPSRFADVLSSCPGIDRIIAMDEGSAPEFDVHASLVSLPRLFHTDSHTIPARIPYLRADAQRQAAWREKLADPPALKVGIAWQASTGDAHDNWQSLPLAGFAQLAAIDPVRLISLQQGPGARRLAECRGQLKVTELDLAADDDAGIFADVAAAIANLDLVIVPDVALAHLAGALGATVWVALSYVPDWRWQLDRDDSPWYPNMRLFRQPKPGDWNSVFEQLACALQQRIALMEASEGKDPKNEPNQADPG